MKTKTVVDMHVRAEEVASILKLLAHPTRLKLLCSLVDGEKSVQDLMEVVGASQVSVSQFLGLMRAEGLLKNRKEGAFVYYRILDPRLFELIATLHRVFCKDKK